MVQTIFKIIDLWIERLDEAAATPIFPPAFDVQVILVRAHDILAKQNFVSMNYRDISIKNSQMLPAGKLQSKSFRSLRSRGDNSVHTQSKKCNLAGRLLSVSRQACNPDFHGYAHVSIVSVTTE
jgi:hypothetical protein